MNSLSNPQKYLIALAILFLILLIVPQLKQSKESSSEVTKDNSTEAALPKHGDSALTPSVGSTQEKSPAEQTTARSDEFDTLGDELDVELVDDDLGPRQLWAVDHERQDPPIKLDPSISDPKTLELKDNWKEQFDIGEDVEFQLPYQEVVARIEDVTNFPNGDKSWSGHLKGYDDDYAVVVTVGKKVSFATILTPSGEYTVEIIEDKGAVYKSPTVNELSADDSPDYVIPPIAPRRN